MITLETLERAVADHPDDAVAWSVLGDYLQERGDPLGTQIAHGDLATADERAHALVAVAPWLAREMLEVRWHHGVPHAVTVDGIHATAPDEVLEGLAGLLALPIARLVRCVELRSGIPRAALELIDTALAHVRVLDANTIYEQPPYGLCSWGATGADQLVCSALFAQLEHLDLGGHLIGDAGASTLANATTSKLLALHLANNNIGPSGAAVLVGSRTLGALDSLNLHCNLLGDAGLEAIAALDEHPTLRALRFSWNGITAAGVHRLARSPVLRSVGALEWGLDAIGDDGVAALVGSPHLGKLRHLGLMSTEITDVGACQLADSELLGGLTELALGQNRITDRGVIALARSPHCAHLTKLNLELMRSISDAGLVALAESPYLTNLDELWLWSDDCSKGVNALLASSTLSERVKHSIRSQHGLATTR